MPPRKVLPHEVQAKRGKDKKSLSAEEALSSEDYAFLLEDNALDLLFYHISKRISLERMCGTGILPLLSTDSNIVLSVKI